MQDDTADKLHPEGLHSEDTPRRLTHGGKRLRQELVKLLARIVALLEFVRLCTKLCIGKSLHLRLQRLYLIRNGIYFFQFLFGMAAEQFIK